MELKKNPEHDLQKKRGLFFDIGLLVSLAAVLIAFEWKSFEGDNYDLGQLNLDEIEEEIIPITQQNTPPPPPPPPPPVQEILKIVEDDVVIEDEVEIDSEADEDTEIEEIEYEDPSVIIDKLILSEIGTNNTAEIYNKLKGGAVKELIDLKEMISDI